MRVPFSISLAPLGWLVLGAFSLAGEIVWPEPTGEGLEYFERTIRPILANACYDCHSAKAQKLKGDLRLDTWEGISKGGTSGPAILPGDPENSPLVQAVRWLDKDFQMPPKDKLSDTVRIELERWVKMGAPFPRNSKPLAKADVPETAPLPPTPLAWPFLPLAMPAVPQFQHWSDHPVDRFLMAQWEKRQIEPAPMAQKQALLRRATFDLTGLPPLPEHVDAFLADSAPDAFERVVDRLLASPAYGERWGRHWLDLVRYADTGGDSADYPVPEAHKYRDYVIDAFNSDKPYNVFLTEQLAGDLMVHSGEAQRREHLIATGYIAISRRFGVQPDMNLTIDDTIDNVGKTMLGLTVACARCHNHKFDPIPTKDYYALWGIFGSTKYPFPGSENVRRPSDFVPLASQATVEVTMAPFKDELDEVETEIQILKDDRAFSEGNLKKPVAQFRKELAALEKKRSGVLDRIPKLEMAYGVSEGKPSDEPVHVRGDPVKSGPVAPRGFLTVLGGQLLPPEQKSQTSGRLQLANWICDPKNPLTARVMVNRIWQHHFGRGLVASVNDWGKQGKPPSHPELIDFLAATFIQNGYSIKSMHRLIMGSKAYQLSCEQVPGSEDVDNQWVGRFNRRRLDAEQLRDAILAISGQLDLKRPGAHPFPPQNEWNWTQHKAFAAVYDNNYRSVYQMQQRIKKHPFFGLFDGADPNACTGERNSTITPLQALFLMNDPFMKTQSEKFAQRLLNEQPTQEARVSRAYWLVYGRACTEQEQADALGFLKDYEAKTQPPERATELAWAALARVLLSSNEFIFTE